jgi:hypothetical protein
MYGEELPDGTTEKLAIWVQNTVGPVTLVSYNKDTRYAVGCGINVEKPKKSFDSNVIIPICSNSDTIVFDIPDTWITPTHPVYCPMQDYNIIEANIQKAQGMTASRDPSCI